MKKLADSFVSDDERNTPGGIPEELEDKNVPSFFIDGRALLQYPGLFIPIYWLRETVSAAWICWVSRVETLTSVPGANIW